MTQRGEPARGRRGRWARYVGLGFLACGLLGACGGRGSWPGAPEAAPTPAASPRPVSGGFLHVLSGGVVATYRIDGDTGQLQPSATQEVPGGLLSGERQGRFVYVAGARSGEGRIVAYAPDTQTGSLREVSSATSHPAFPSGTTFGYSAAWRWIAASSTRVYAMWYTTTYHDTYPTYVTHAVSSDGQLGPAYQEGVLPTPSHFSEWDAGGVVVDVDSDVLYKGTQTGGLDSYAVQADGHLRSLGSSHHCGRSLIGYADPFLVVKGLVFASAYVGYDLTVCTYDAPHLAPRANLGPVALRGGAAFAPAPGEVPRLSSDMPDIPSSHPSTLVATETRIGSDRAYRFEVRLFRVEDDGELRLLDAVDGPANAAPFGLPRLLFHPTGRFLFATHASSDPSKASLTVYVIRTGGRLDIVERRDGVGGDMALSSFAGP